jgi:glucosamine 6-phosphate synthetase-like amidotransferase/phosphosugar isomerase protein
MITAAAALALSRAKLTEQEHDLLAKTMLLVEQTVNEKMQYDGVLIDAPGMPRHLAVALQHMLATHGWVCNAQPYERPAKYSKNVVQTGFWLQISPSEKAYDEANALRRAGLQ